MNAIEDDDESVELSSKSSYEQMLHPNAEKQDRVTVYKGCAKYLYRFDEGIMKPIFIRNHEKDATKKQKEFFELFMRVGQEIEEDYSKVDQLKKKKTMIRDATFGMLQYGPESTVDQESNLGVNQNDGVESHGPTVHKHSRNKNNSELEFGHRQSEAVSSISRQLTKTKQRLRKNKPNDLDNFNKNVSKTFNLPTTVIEVTEQIETTQQTDTNDDDFTKAEVAGTDNN